MVAELPGVIGWRFALPYLVGGRGVGGVHDIVTTAAQANNERGVSGYRRGDETRSGLLAAAHRVLVTAGYANFSMRRVATEAGVSVGNLQYYFPTKDALTTALLDNVIEDYLLDFDAMRATGTPREQFERIIRAVFEDLRSPDTTRFFPELWSLANHEPQLTARVDAMYARYRAVLAELVTAINPRVGEQQAAQLAVFFSSSIEGHTMFVGHEKPMEQDIDVYIAMAIDSFLHLICASGEPQPG